MKKNTFADFAICMARAYEPYRRRITERFSLSAAETDVLMFLANNPEYNTAAQISKIRMIPKSHVSLAVSSLSEKGLVAKKNGADHRSVCLNISDAAVPIVDFGRKMQNEFQETLFRGFSASEKALFDSMHEKMRENLENMKKQNGDQTK